MDKAQASSWLLWHASAFVHALEPSSPASIFRGPQWIQLRSKSRRRLFQRPKQISQFWFRKTKKVNNESFLQHLTVRLDHTFLGTLNNSGEGFCGFCLKLLFGHLEKWPDHPMAGRKTERKLHKFDKWSRHHQLPPWGSSAHKQRAQAWSPGRSHGSNLNQQRHLWAKDSDLARMIHSWVNAVPD